MFSRLTGHMRHNLVAYLALFMALGGTSAWAAGQITGAQIRDDSVTGADVLESSLDAVPKALDATTLGTQSLTQVRSGIDADKLDGRDASAFLGNVVVRVSSQGSVVNVERSGFPQPFAVPGDKRDAGREKTRGKRMTQVVEREIDSGAPRRWSPDAGLEVVRTPDLPSR